MFDSLQFKSRATKSQTALVLGCSALLVSFQLWAYEPFSLAPSSNLMEGGERAFLDSLNVNSLDAASWSGSPSIHLLLGGQQGIGGGTSALGQHTSAWQAIYEQPNVFSPLGAQVSYLNEGYLGPQNVPWAFRLSQPLHYRDSYAVQLNYWSPLRAYCRVGAALGPELYFDTMATTYRNQYQDRHGIGLEPSVSGQCRLTSRLTFEAVASRSLDIASYGATAVLLGFTYTPRSAAETESTDNDTVSASSKYLEFTGGKSDVDSFRLSQETGSAVWVTYGAALRNPFALEFSLLTQNVSSVMQRHGGAAQFTVQHEFTGARIQIFAGAGPEFAKTSDDADHTSSTQVNLLLSYGIKVPLGDRASIVLRFGRLESASGRDDTDLLTAGVAIKL
jgi:hypothetical protein